MDRVDVAVKARSGGLCELGEVVGGADQRPLGPHFLDAAQQELAVALICPNTGSTICFLNRCLLRHPARFTLTRIAWVSGPLWQRPWVVLGTPRGDVGGDAA